LNVPVADLGETLKTCTGKLHNSKTVQTTENVRTRDLVQY
jgi:hypothetical protein